MVNTQDLKTLRYTLFQDRCEGHWTLICESYHLIIVRSDKNCFPVSRIISFNDENEEYLSFPFSCLFMNTYS